jgi:hypothetical protein
MDLKNVFLTSMIPDFPSIYDYNNRVFQNYLNLFYDASTSGGILIKPVNTTGRVKGATGEFVTLIADDVIVKRNITQLNEDTSTYSGTFIVDGSTHITVLNGLITDVSVY